MTQENKPKIIARKQWILWSWAENPYSEKSYPEGTILNVTTDDKTGEKTANPVFNGTLDDIINAGFQVQTSESKSGAPFAFVSKRGFRR